MIAAQLAAGRDVRIQTLDLAPADAEWMVAELRQTRGLGEAYDFFDANCSTRVRDLVDEAAGGRLRATAGASNARWTLRERVAGYTAGRPLLHLTVHTLLGSSVDRAPDPWSDLFLPETLAAAVVEAGLVTTDHTLEGGSVAWQPPPPRPVGGIGWVVAGVTLGLLLVAPWPRGIGALLGGAWAVAAGLAGLAALALQATAVHALVAGNLDGWILNPAWLLVALGAWGSRAVPTRAFFLAAALTTMSASLAVGAALGALGGVTGAVTSLALPAHLAVTLRLGRAARTAAPDPTAAPDRSVER